MSHKVENKKRFILENLNNHLQVQAARLKNVGIETNILPESTLNHSSLKQKTISIPTNTNHALKKKTPVFSNHKTSQPKVRKLRPYDPLYTWNRGGRLKELRIRCQARKFFHLWRNKTIGRISFAQAERHHRLSLLKLCWKNWYSHHWQLRIEPRLFGRAILYHKAVLMRTVVRSWKLWVNERLLLRIKVEIAEKFHVCHIQKSAFHNWVSWILINKWKQKLKSMSGNLVTEKILHRTFHFWRMALQEKLECNSKLVIADSHHRNILMKKVFRKWIEIRSAIQASNLKYLKSTNHYKSVLIHKVFAMWNNYHHRQKLKLKEKERWHRHYNWNLAHRYLKIWKDRYSLSLVQAAFATKVERLGRQFQMRKSFIHWRKYNNDEKIRLQKLKKAEEFRALRVQKNVLSRMMRHLSHRKEKKSLRDKAETCYNQFILRRHLTHWISQHEEKDHNDQLVEIGAARSHYRRTLFSKCLREWSKYMTIAKFRTVKLEAAETLYNKHLLERVMASWKEYVGLSTEEQEVEKLRQVFVRKNVVKKCWLKWKKKYNHHQLQKNKLKEFLSYQREMKRKQIFDKWRVLASTKTKETEGIKKAQIHYTRSLLKKCFLAISQYAQHREYRRLNADIATVHFQQKNLIKVFGRWKEYCYKQSYYRNLLLFRYNKIKHNIKYSIFQCLKGLVEEKHARIKKADEICEENRRKFTLQCFRVWQRYATKRRAKKIQNFHRFSDSKAQIDERKRKKIFQIWRTKTSVKVDEINKIRQSELFYHQNCIRKYFHVWVDFYENQKMNARRKEQSLWFWQKSTQVRVWITWRKALSDRQREQYYTRFALVHWSNKLQGKVIIAWLNYTVDRRQRNQRETEAYNLYRNRIKKYTVRQWLSSADFLLQWRTKRHKSINRNSSAVIKAVEQWKRFTQIKKSKSQSIKPFFNPLRPEVERGEIYFQKKTTLVPKTRPQPKVPSFLFQENHLQIKVTRPPDQPRDVPLCSQFTVIKESLRDQTDFVDDFLMPPVCFESDCNHKARENRNSDKRTKDLVKELNDIKERLQHFKESKSILRNLEDELSEYDELVNRLTPGRDSSFHREFDLSGYREKLVTNIENLRKEILEENAACVQLSKRFQDIIKCQINK